ncbi:hypothetical protein [Sporisorium scitamineum]|uniref:Uncharacterized protein n=1 Tax=Sporisorium scitamineum TaxID=49012 RepID=A0A0F7S6S0_9BASI|nr:hypothetical protein [Sporisorium scitamineum]
MTASLALQERDSRAYSTGSGPVYVFYDALQTDGQASWNANRCNSVDHEKDA